MSDQVKQQRFSLITDKGVCGELLISPESAIRHTHGLGVFFDLDQGSAACGSDRIPSHLSASIRYRFSPPLKFRFRWNFC
jgi:hypothetical protein